MKLISKYKIFVLSILILLASFLLHAQELSDKQLEVWHEVENKREYWKEGDLDSVLSAITGFRTVHHMNLKHIEDEVQFVIIAEVFNKLVAELGYQNVQYNFWKFTGDRQGRYGYIFESNWPDKETFDEVHEYEEFIVTLDKWYPIFKSMISEEVYSRYVILNR